MVKFMGMMTFEYFFRERTRTQPLYSFVGVLLGSTVWKIISLLAENKGQLQNTGPSTYVGRPNEYVYSHESADNKITDKRQNRQTE